MHELDMARAKAPRANIGMAVFGDDKKKNPYENIHGKLEEITLPTHESPDHDGNIHNLK